MKLKDVLTRQAAEDVQAKEQALAELESALMPAVSFARNELMAIEAAVSDFRSYTKEQFDGIPDAKLPSAIAEILSRADSLANNPNAVRQAIKEAEGLTIQDVHGRRPDGARDVNAGPNLRGAIIPRLQLARGCAAAIRNLLEKLKFAVADLEERASSREETLSVGDAPRPVTIKQPRPDDGAGPLRTAARFDPRVKAS